MPFIKYFSELCPFENVTYNDIQMSTCSIIAYILLDVEYSPFFIGRSSFGAINRRQLWSVIIPFCISRRFYLILFSETMPLSVFLFFSPNPHYCDIDRCCQCL